MQNDERRQHPRIPVSIAVVLYCGPEIFSARARDVSLGGMGLVLPRPLERGALVTVSFFLVRDQAVVEPSTERLSLAGEIVWAARSAGGFDTGIRFSSANEAMLGRLSLFLEMLDRDHLAGARVD